MREGSRGEGGGSDVTCVWRPGWPVGRRRLGCRLAAADVQKSLQGWPTFGG